MKTRSNSFTLLCIALSACVLAGSSGCGAKSFKPSKVFSLDNAWPFDDDDPDEGIPVRIVGAWTDTVKTTAGQPAQRGFGGRLMFYDAENDKPILVDGQLVVYAFDEAGRVPTDNKPTRRYVFPSDQVKLHMSKNDMGASYSFWLPWDEAGGPKADVSLICRFEPKGGAVITGEQTRHALPGSMPTETPGATAASPRVPEGVPMRPAQMTLEQYQAQQRVPGAVQTAGYEAPIHPQPAAAGVAAAPVNDPYRQMSVTSIPLPNDFQVPAGVNPQPIATAASQVLQAAPPAQYQQLQYQQQIMPAQPAMQTAQPPVMNGAGMMQQMPPVPGQIQHLNPISQRPLSTPVNVPGISVPQNQNFTAPITMPHYSGQRPTMPQVAQPMMPPQQQVQMSPQQQVQMLPQQQVQMVSAQPVTTMPAQQIGPQQGYQQPPSPNGVRTAVSYGPPATIPWR